MALPEISSLERFVAIVVYFDPVTGWRPGGIDVHKEAKDLFCMPLWQDLERGVEMRLILRDWDAYIARFTGVPGIEIVEGKEAINAKVAELFRARYWIASPVLVQLSVTQKGIDVTDIPPDTPPEEVARILHGRGALGIRRMEPYLLPP